MTLLSESPLVFAEPFADAAWRGPLADVVGADLDVPLVTGGSARYVNLDYAASAPALRAVADQVTELLPLYSSVHRGAGYASAVCTSAYEAARATLAAFTGARGDDVVIFTRNTTDALNLLATAARAARRRHPERDRRGRPRRRVSIYRYAARRGGGSARGIPGRPPGLRAFRDRRGCNRWLVRRVVAGIRVF